jgi:hypothetical protein
MNRDIKGTICYTIEEQFRRVALPFSCDYEIDYTASPAVRSWNRDIPDDPAFVEWDAKLIRLSRETGACEPLIQEVAQIHADNRAWAEALPALLPFHATRIEELCFQDANDKHESAREEAADEPRQQRA